MRSLPAVLALALLACGDSEPPEAPPVPVRVVVLSPQEGAFGLRYSASVDPSVQVDLDFEVEGYVESILSPPGPDGRPRPLQPGDPVQEGEELAAIGAREYRDRVDEAAAHLARAEAALRKSRAQFERDSRLFATRSITAPDYDRARKDFESGQAETAEARAQLDAARGKLGDCSITAPLAGVVLERAIEVGSYVRPGTRAFSVGDTSSVKVVFGVPDTAVGALEMGSPLEISTAATGGRVFTGQITQIAPASEARTRVFEIEVTVPNPDGVLRPGMIASLRTDAAGPSASPGLAVPIAAVLRAPEDPEGYAVATVEGGDGDAVARVRAVELGELLGDSVVVTSGLEVGQRVIVRGAKQVHDGDAVRVIP